MGGRADIYHQSQFNNDILKNENLLDPRDGTDSYSVKWIEQTQERPTLEGKFLVNWPELIWQSTFHCFVTHDVNMTCQWHTVTTDVSVIHYICCSVTLRLWWRIVTIGHSALWWPNDGVRSWLLVTWATDQANARPLTWAIVLIPGDYFTARHQCCYYPLWGGDLGENCDNTSPAGPSVRLLCS